MPEGIGYGPRRARRAVQRPQEAPDTLDDPARQERGGLRQRIMELLGLDDLGGMMEPYQPGEEQPEREVPAWMYQPGGEREPEEGTEPDEERRGLIDLIRGMFDREEEPDTLQRRQAPMKRRKKYSPSVSADAGGSPRY